MFDYEGRIFRSISNDEHGEVNEETIFHYHQDKEIVWGEYSGGLIIRGTLIALVLADGSLDLRYQHINAQGEIRTGLCHSTPEILPDGRYRLHEEWTWTSGHHGSGSSLVEEIAHDELLR